MNEHAARRDRLWLGIAVASTALVFTRLRTHLSAYVDLHRWMAGLGIGDGVRNLDAPILMLLGALLGAALASDRPLVDLGWRGRCTTGLRFGLVVSVPMFVCAALVGRFAPSANLIEGALLAPVVEETLFRGMLVAVVVRVGGLPFWPVAIASSLLFGSVHVPWDDTLAGHHLGPFAITAAGGLWYAWLLREHDWNLWVTVALHAGMNAAWLVFRIDGGAVGSGLWPNVGRALTIASGTIWTVRSMRRRPHDAPPPTA